jgi:hypothetical protein
VHGLVHVKPHAEVLQDGDGRLAPNRLAVVEPHKITVNSRRWITKEGGTNTEVRNKGGGTNSQKQTTKTTTHNRGKLMKSQMDRKTGTYSHANKHAAKGGRETKKQTHTNTHTATIEQAAKQTDGKATHKSTCQLSVVWGQRQTNPM